MNIEIINVVLPNKPLSDSVSVKKLKISNFREVLLNKLPQSRKKECWIVNLDGDMNDGMRGTHWVAWYKKHEYFVLLWWLWNPASWNISYLEDPVLYPTYEIQDFYQLICGHLYILY